ncbi:MAG: site-specific integrase [Candidatus Methanoperedenaceae archaeon]|nr:site-specific integrase [Candidatus Methanoperedenaceae archaeon]
MKPTDFSKYLTDYLTRYLTHERGCSSNTIIAYRDTFVLFITFMHQVKNIKAEKLFMKSITRASVVEFLDWLQSERKCSDATRNLRLAVLHSFFKYVQYLNPDNLYEYQDIMSIKVKKARSKALNYLTVDGIKLLLEQPDITTKRGYRDLALLSLMYDTGARVQEMINLTPSAIHLDKPYTIQITGKGNKTRIVPLLEEQVKILRNYLTEFDLLKLHTRSYPLFFNSRCEKLTRTGVTHILLKYADKAKKTNPKLIPEKLSCHSLRHSKAMHLLQAGVNLVYIRDILGHVSVQTTEIYARADSKLKREAIEKAYVDVVPKEEPFWENNENLLSWLKSF